MTWLVFGELPLDDSMAMAIPDLACPFIDARFANCNFAKSSPYLAALSPVENWRELGLDPAAPYFNSGVMVLNVQRMREERIEIELLDCLKQNERYVWCWDQYALNVVFANHWKPLPLRWNQGAHFFEFPDEQSSPLNSTEFLQAREHPAIVHFTTEWKPWHYGNRHPLKHLFFEQLDQTAWKGWRPERPGFDLHSTWQSLATEVVKRAVVCYRKFGAMIKKPKFDSAADELPNVKQLFPLRPQRSSETHATEVPRTKKKKLTLFTIPKPFVGAAKTAQINAISSWKRMSEFVDLILIGDEEGVAEFAIEIGVKHVPGVRSNEHGTPLLSSAFELARQNSDTPYLAYCNCDIVLFDEFEAAIERLILSERLEQFLAIGRRTNLRLDHLVDFGSVSEVSGLREQFANQGVPDSLVCKEYFVFPRNTFKQIPDFAVGRGNWDNWMVHHAKANGIPVVSLSDCVIAGHQDHDHVHSGGRLNSYVTGDEAKTNQQLAGGRHLISGTVCDYRLSDDGLKEVPLKKLAGEFWLDFHRFGSLMLDLLGVRSQRKNSGEGFTSK